jgi:hypothetical protein
VSAFITTVSGAQSIPDSQRTASRSRSSIRRLL